MIQKLTTAIAVALIFAGTYAWINRYELRIIPNTAGSYILDRWTGRGCLVVLAEVQGCFELKKQDSK
jgi:hypothetical protein